MSVCASDQLDDLITNLASQPTVSSSSRPYKSANREALKQWIDTVPDEQLLSLMQAMNSTGRVLPATDEKEEENFTIPGQLPNPNLNLSPEQFENVFLSALSVGEECLKDEELKNLLLRKPTRPIAYDGFEPSGRMHIAQGVLKSICVNKLTDAGVDFVFWVADWFALLNNKMGGDLKRIRTVGAYMIEVWKACGMNMEHVHFKWASDEINQHADEYWMTVIDISRQFSVARTKRCCTILGRQESDEMPTAHLLYAAMQCADIYFLRADICQLGLDQRKVNVLAREYFDKQKKVVKKRFRRAFPPIVLSHHMLAGLKQGQEKMSKSHSDSAIFMEDTPGDVKRKIKGAFCPPGIVQGNPCMDYLKHIIFPRFGQFEIKRSEEHGGNALFHSYEELEEEFLAERIHPGDLKPALTTALNDILEPVRQHFENDPNAKALLKKVRSFKVTR